MWCEAPQSSTHCKVFAQKLLPLILSCCSLALKNAYTASNWVAESLPNLLCVPASSSLFCSSDPVTWSASPLVNRPPPFACPIVSSLSQLLHSFTTTLSLLGFCRAFLRFTQFSGYPTNSKHCSFSWLNFWQWLHLGRLVLLAWLWPQLLQFVVTTAFNAAPSTRSCPTNSLAMACCRSSGMTKTKTLLRLGRGSRDRMSERSVPYTSESTPIKNWCIFLPPSACSSPSQLHRYNLVELGNFLIHPIRFSM